MSWLEQLTALCDGRAPCVLGIGNRLAGDDAAGPVLCDELRGRFSGPSIDAGVAPENFLERVVAFDPKVVLVVDAVDFGGDPGELRLLEPQALIGASLSTHACSPRMLDEYLAARRSPEKDRPPVVRWLGIQPQANRSELSPAVADSLHRLAKQLCDRWPAEATP